MSASDDGSDLIMKPGALRRPLTAKRLQLQEAAMVAAQERFLS